MAPIQAAPVPWNKTKSGISRIERNVVKWLFVSDQRIEKSGRGDWLSAKFFHLVIGKSGVNNMDDL